MIVLGGGGYTIANVSRCWAYETSLLLGMHVPDEIPQNDFYSSYGPFYKLYYDPDPRIENKNSAELLDKVTTEALQNIKLIEGAPSVQLHDRPPSLFPKDTFDINRPVVKEFYD
jgi:hypothetical protein